jgi:hypothetical protein
MSMYRKLNDGYNYKSLLSSDLPNQFTLIKYGCSNSTLKPFTDKRVVTTRINSSSKVKPVIQCEEAAQIHGERYPYVAVTDSTCTFGTNLDNKLYSRNCPKTQSALNLYEIVPNL